MNEVSGVMFSAGRKFSHPVLFGIHLPQKSLSRFNEERHDDANDRLNKHRGAYYVTSDKGAALTRSFTVKLK